MKHDWDMLLFPERHETLPSRSDADRILCLWRTGTVLRGISYSIFKTHAPHGFVVRRIVMDGDAVFGDEAPASDELVENILAAFEALQLPAFRRPTTVGCDGQTTGIIFGTYWRRTDIQWWSGCGDDWESLAHAWASARWDLERLFSSHTRQYSYC